MDFSMPVMLIASDGHSSELTPSLAMLEDISKEGKIERMVRIRFKAEGWTCPFIVKKDEEALYVRLDMPGIVKEEVKIWIEDGYLYVKGKNAAAKSRVQAEAEADSLAVAEATDELGFKEEGPRRYKLRLELPNDDGCEYKVENVKAVMKIGVLKMVLPKLKVKREKNRNKEDVPYVKVY